jgi:chromosome segregation ATPase
MTEREFEVITRQLDRLEDKIDGIERENQLLSDRLELYRQTGDAQIRSIEAQTQSIRAEVEAFQTASQQQMETFQTASQQQIETFQASVNQQIEAMNRQIEAFQDANKQQLNVSLGVLVTAAITIVVSVILGMQ